MKNNVAKMRKERDFTQSELASLIGVHWRTIQNWESEKGLIQVDGLAKLSKAFGCSMEDILVLD